MTRNVTSPLSRDAAPRRDQVAKAKNARQWEDRKRLAAETARRRQALEQHPNAAPWIAFYREEKARREQRSA